MTELETLLQQKKQQYAQLDAELKRAQQLVQSKIAEINACSGAIAALEELQKKYTEGA